MPIFADCTFQPGVLKKILLVWREHGWPTVPQPHHRGARIDRVINHRAALLDRLNACTEFGKVAFIRDGMDCDCTQYLHVDHIDRPVSIVAWMESEDKRCEWLDGPESAYFGRPSEYPEQNASSDRALEAYEDGHPHSITMISLW